MVGVAQLAERLPVEEKVAGAEPVTHPKDFNVHMFHERNPGVPTNFHYLLAEEQTFEPQDLQSAREEIARLIASDSRFSPLGDPAYVSQINGLIMMEHSSDEQMEQIITELRTLGSDMADIWQQRLNYRRQLGYAATEFVESYRILEREIYQLWIRSGKDLIFLGT